MAWTESSKSWWTIKKPKHMEEEERWVYVKTNKTFYSPLASWANPYFLGLNLAIDGLARIFQASI